MAEHTCVLSLTQRCHPATRPPAASRPTRAAPAVAAATAAAAAPSQSSAELLSRTQYDMAGISTIVGKVDGCYQVRAGARGVERLPKGPDLLHAIYRQLWMPAVSA